MILEVQYLDTKQKEKFQTTKTKCVVGRSKNADIWVNREELSRAHFEIEWVEKDFFITDLNSTNGLVINGERLPPGERSLYKNIFPIEIGDRISILAFSDDQLPTQEEVATNLNPQFNNLASSLPSARDRGQTPSSADVSITVARERRTGGPPPRIKKEEKKKLPLIPILAVVGLGGAIYFHLENKNTRPVNSTNPSGETSVQVNIKAQVPELKTAQLDFRALLDKASCDSFSDLCKTLDLKRQREGIFEHENKLMVFINLGDFSLENPHKRFRELKDNEKSEYFQAHIGTNPILIKYVLEKKYTHLLVVGFGAAEGIVVMKSLSNINFEVLKDMNQNTHQAFFSNIFYGGSLRDYKEGLKKYIEFSQL